MARYVFGHEDTKARRQKLSVVAFEVVELIVCNCRVGLSRWWDGVGHADTLIACPALRL
jgi:hypothetical protein